MDKPRKIIIMGHRGANKIAPENTLKSFKKAIELGADIVEFDVRQSRDGEIVIIHDEDTFRTTGQKGLVEDMNLFDLKQLDFGENEKIPTLEELINLAKGKISLNCEIKVEGIIKKIVKIFQDTDLIDSVILSSFIHKELIKAKRIAPNIKLAALIPEGTGLLIDWYFKKRAIDKAVKNKFFAINPLYKLVNRQFVDYAHKKGLKVYPWTVDSGIAIKKLVNVGVDGIITNDIERAKEVLNYSS